MNDNPDEKFWARINAYLRFERRRARSAPYMLLLAFVGLGLLMSAQWHFDAPWPYRIGGLICIGVMIAIVAFDSGDR